MRVHPNTVGVASVTGVGRLLLSRHAVERFIERARPTLTFELAVDELRRLLQTCGQRIERPAWVSDDTDVLDDACSWVSLTEDIVVVVNEPKPDVLVACTCLARGHISDLARAHRARLRRARADRRRFAGDPRDARSVRRAHGEIEAVDWEADVSVGGH